MKLKDVIIDVAEEVALVVLAKLLGRVPESERERIQAALDKATRDAVAARFAAMPDLDVDVIRRVKPYPWMEGMDVERVEPTGDEPPMQWPPRRK